MSGPEAEHGLGRGGSRQPAMGPQPEVVLESRRKPGLEVGPEEGRPRPELAERLQGPEEPLDEGDGAGPADGAVAVADAVAGEARAEDIRGELGALVGDRVAGRAEAPDGHGQEAADLDRARLGEEDSGGERAAGEDVEHDGELEGEEAEQARDLGDVEHPDVVGVAGPDTAAFEGWLRWRGWDGRWLLPADALDGPTREPPAGVGERGSDRASPGNPARVRVWTT